MVGFMWNNLYDNFLQNVKQKYVQPTQINDLGFSFMYASFENE